ncbi:TetR/AcrR family transcriptional regulator [Micromonospora sp. NBC_01796]|uniref:TetR/AcrR family transcriptional regulator n=1 Tax=Micromonospora sp. NBC_01796 TaxID=2975987 RepID=UPI002DDABE1E|nr:TetR/AcrR family transcriptional regulator [Micromonospora sp. NBC_01796]WSA83789.1 TetR/AcrR family transcriptional regulator [Micromonospora sp. NBC_01796]
MGRVSQAQAQENRRQVVAAAARLFRERGVQAVSVADLMAEVGLTHGGFYRQFTSKEALLTEATVLAFADLAAQLGGFDDQRPGDHDAARQDLIDYYLSTEHRDDLGQGCPTTGLSSDIANEDVDGTARPAYAEGVGLFARWLSTDGNEDLATLSMLVGALTLARATAGSDLSERILAAAHEALPGVAAPRETPPRPED